MKKIISMALLLVVLMTSLMVYAEDYVIQEASLTVTYKEWIVSEKKYSGALAPLLHNTFCKWV